jgi:hypothetical protein
MTEFWLATEWFVWGFVAGVLAKPAWNIAWRVWQEAKLARDQWSQPRG